MIVVADKHLLLMLCVEKKGGEKAKGADCWCCDFMKTRDHDPIELNREDVPSNLGTVKLPF